MIWFGKTQKGRGIRKDVDISISKNSKGNNLFGLRISFKNGCVNIFDNKGVIIGFDFDENKKRLYFKGDNNGLKIQRRTHTDTGYTTFSDKRIVLLAEKLIGDYNLEYDHEKFMFFVDLDKKISE